jgi:hypothetical protein
MVCLHILATNSTTGLGACGGRRTACGVLQRMRLQGSRRCMYVIRARQQQQHRPRTAAPCECRVQHSRRHRTSVAMLHACSIVARVQQYCRGGSSRQKASGRASSGIAAAADWDEMRVQRSLGCRGRPQRPRLILETCTDSVCSQLARAIERVVRDERARHTHARTHAAGRRRGARQRRGMEVCGGFT